ncbi:HipA family kinase [Piscinibacter koreensis]|uniref:Aminotransferase class I and II n=1 Tax=Piscinibacter koreensis TaxID=2742824 RepID=A0A7Y6TW27_9BURK|nr:HipA family kinase [Schlegelella koreensis]NUZ05582.1 aminotransferase class I and II [Schlegelella koreensis]
MRTVTATRYVTPLREGGSLPAIVEADDSGMYVLKFRGAGQGPRALIAELVAGEIARATGLPVPEIVFVRLDGDLARTEPDPEIQDLIRASATPAADSGEAAADPSAGINLALDYLPGSVTFDPLAFEPDPELASRIVWFDAFVTNLDRTPRNTNMLVWHRKLWLIDHGAALYVHHDWRDVETRAKSAFALVRDHVLIGRASRLAEVDADMAAAVTPELIDRVVAAIPDSWLEAHAPFASHAEHRAAYVRYLTLRLAAPRAFLEEAIRAHAEHV